jgi:hypothetical protein
MTTIPEYVPVRLPRPRPWSEPITEDQHGVFAPDGLELIDGYLMGGPEDGKHRWNLLALLLTNIGLSPTLALCSRDDVREAVEHRFGSLYP